MSKEVVDFFFSLLSLHVGTVIRLLSEDGTVGCLGKLYESLENIATHTCNQISTRTPCSNPNQLLLELISSLLTNPINWKPGTFTTVVAMAVVQLTITHPMRTNTVSDSRTRYVSDDPSAICPNCGNRMSNQMSYVAPPLAAKSGAILSSEGGYVKGVVTYMIMDDLEVQPMSTISSIAMLNKFNVKDVGALEEKVVQLGLQESCITLFCCLMNCFLHFCFR